MKLKNELELSKDRLLKVITSVGDFLAYDTKWLTKLSSIAITIPIYLYEQGFSGVSSRNMKSTSRIDVSPVSFKPQTIFIHGYTV